jgi:hypothetical protein
MKDEKRKRLKLEQMEDSMGNGVNVDEWPEAKLKQRADNDVEKRQAIKEGSKQASSRSECTKLERR